MASFLEQLRSMTTVVADSGDINSIKQFRPTDSTTNPSLIAAAAGKPEYQPIVDDVLNQARKDAGSKATDEQIAKKLEDNGIHVTRRTVAKYREDMRIPSTHQRRVKS